MSVSSNFSVNEYEWTTTRSGCIFWVKTIELYAYFCKFFNLCSFVLVVALYIGLVLC
jgi:hypothetical protein